MNQKEKFHPHARRKARRLILQALYQWQIAGQSIADISLQFAEDESMPKADSAYFYEAIKEIPAQCPELDAHLAPFLDRPMVELDPIELAILRMGAYELATQLAIPYRVVINEAVELAKTFGAEDGHKYINGVLDKLARVLRKTEM
jgi:N utilization substance protein B